MYLLMALAQGYDSEKEAKQVHRISFPWPLSILIAWDTCIVF